MLVTVLVLAFLQGSARRAASLWAAPALRLARWPPHEPGGKPLATQTEQEALTRCC